jgi:hypothetical protein
VAATQTTNTDSPAYQEVFAKEVQRALTDDALLDAWASTQLTWQDVGFLAYKVKDPPINYQEGWVNGDKRVVDHE